jgi:hypothetical protein
LRYIDAQSAASITLNNGTVLTKCDQCKEVFEDRKKRGIIGEPICDECPGNPVDLLPDNFIASQIYEKVKGQIILYFNGEVNKELTLNHLAVWAMIDHWPGKIDNPWKVFERVINSYQYFLKERQDNDT